MRRLLMVLLWCCASGTAAAANSFESQQEFGQWITYYYAKPDPTRVPQAIAYMSKSGILDNRNAVPPMFGFLAGVFHDNPDRASSWIDDVSFLPESHLATVVLGVWYANMPASKEAAYRLLQDHPTLKFDLALLLTGSPMSVDEIPLEQGSWVLDALWGNFMATGKSAPVERVITALPWLDVKGDTNRLLVGGAARWSLTSNAVQHDRVFEICEVAVRRQPTNEKARLAAVIEDAKKERNQRHNPTLERTPASGASSSQP